MISESYERPDQSYVQETFELKDLIDTTKLVQKFLPKQTDIDKILDIIKRKVLKDTHLPLTIKEIQAGYLSSPYFKDLYMFLSQNKLPSKRSSIKKVETLAENFVLLDSMLFKLVTTPDKETALLAIPEICVDICRQKSICRSSRCSKNVPYYERQIFHSWFDALSEILHKRMSYMPASKI